VPEPLVPGVLELRVHGVSGTPPHQMLGVAASDVGQVAGDRPTGLYRCREGTPYGVTLPSFAAIEAYSWGAGNPSHITIRPVKTAAGPTYPTRSAQTAIRQCPLRVGDCLVTASTTC
jgi:hypothetical protein